MFPAHNTIIPFTLVCAGPMGLWEFSTFRTPLPPPIGALEFLSFGTPPPIEDSKMLEFPNPPPSRTRGVAELFRPHPPRWKPLVLFSLGPSADFFSPPAPHPPWLVSNLAVLARHPYSGFAKLSTFGTPPPLLDGYPLVLLGVVPDFDFPTPPRGLSLLGTILIECVLGFGTPPRLLGPLTLTLTLTLTPLRRASKDFDFSDPPRGPENFRLLGPPP